ncbi:MAG: pilus assembly protein PilM [Candidatus Omnitrophica bacterium]|nr:pilus assembly protein PilM [Candidatus Omnitrophota bacterium]
MGLFTDKTKTAIEIRESEIKVIQISVSGPAAAIEACVSEAVPSNDVKAASEALSKILKNFNIKPKETVLVIPRQSVTTKTLSLPSHDPAEIEEMAGFQAIKQIPYPKEEITYGVSPIETTAEGYSKVMLVICHKDMVERPLEVMRSCGFSPSKVTLSSIGILNWLRMDPDFMARAGAAPVIVVECDKSATDIVIADKEKVIYTRGLTFGSGGGADYIERLKEEITRTLVTFEKESLTLKPVKAVFTGYLPGMEAHKESLENAMGIKVEFRDAFKVFPSGVPERSRPFTSTGSFASLIGNAAGPDRVDLLPGRFKVARSVKIRRNEAMVSLSLAAAVLILLSLVVVNKLHQKEELLRVLELRLKKTAPSAQEIGRKKELADIVRSESSQRARPLLILNEFYRIAPPSINLALYKYDEGRVDIKGTSSALSEVFRFVKLLDDSPYFENVEVKYAAKRKTPQAEFVDFEISCPLSGKAAK